MLLVQAIEEFFKGYFSTHERSGKTKIAYRSDLDQEVGPFGNRQTEKFEAIPAKGIKCENPGFGL
ncbi:MAG TPA: hypothetical protein VGN10_03615 [Pyrinomonadaceae bacterium]